MNHEKVEYFIMGVKTLTDARYFSAMGADFLHFDLDPKSPFFIDGNQYRAIIEWVEGSQVICSFDHLFDEEEIRSLIEIPQVSGVLSQYPDMLDYVHRIQPEALLFQRLHGDPAELDKDLPLAGIVTDRETVSSERQYILYPDAELAMDGILRNKEEYGVALHPGGEEEVGIKDFEIYDRLFYGEF